MWPFRDAKNAIPTFTVENTIGSGSRVRGDLTGPGGFRIDGAVEGTIDADGPVVVGAGGLVEGSIDGHDVVVLGCVRGDVRAVGHLEIGPKGKVLGDITVKSFRMHTGGVFRGVSCMPGGEALPAMALGESLIALTARGGRTLPPPNGAVPPPPMLAKIAEIAEIAEIVPDKEDGEDQVSHPRLLSSEADKMRRAGGT